MSRHFLGSSAQTKATQTLYLLSPSYTDFDGATSGGETVLINPSATISTANPGHQSDKLQHQQQQQYAWLSRPSTTVSPSTVSQQSNIVSMLNPCMRHQKHSSVQFTDGVNKEQGYCWNEFSFLPSTDMEEDDGQGLTSRLGIPQQAADLSHHDRLRVLPQPSSRELNALNSSTTAVGLESWQSSSGNILSLSLSPQQQPAMVQLQSLPIQGVSDCSVLSNNTGIDNIPSRGERLLDRADGSLSSFRVSLRDDLMQTDLDNCRQANMVASTATIELYSLKYLKAVQLLLNEVVSVGRSIKRSTFNNVKIAPWMGPNHSSEGFLTKDKKFMKVNALDGTSAGSLGSCAVKDGGVHAISFAPVNDGNILEQKSKIAVELTLAERQELQMKKTKLLAMLDKVDQQYQQYCHQLQLVVGSFESAAGLGTAQTYTALALQTISKHFRCLKDAIRGQIQASCRSLGEEDTSGQGRKGTSKLHFIDQQLTQQRALQQLGVIQQPAWRPQRGLPERSVSILRAWLFEHFLHPYPKDSDKHFLARQAGLTRNQVSNWFINARVRLWKPMVEEMYAEEIKEDEVDCEAEELDKAAKGEEKSSHNNIVKEARGNSPTINIAKTEKLQYTVEDAGQFSNPTILPDYSFETIRSNIVAGNDSFLSQPKVRTSQGIKRARSGDGPQDSLASLLSSYNGTHMEMNPSEEVHDSVKLHRGAGHIVNYSMPHDGHAQVNHQNLGAGYGWSHAGGLNGYPHDAGRAAIGGVSLTLGLQEIGGLPQVLTSSSSSSGICKGKESSCRW